MTYLLFHMVGHNGETPQHDYEDKVVIRLIDTSAEQALERAKKLLEKKWWFIAEVVEFKEN